MALGSAAQAMEGHHYYSCMHLHEELFDELVQFRFEKVKDERLPIFFKVLEKHKLAT